MNLPEPPELPILSAPWLTAASARAVLAALGGAGHFVGGCVRNALLGAGATDVDIATPLKPEEVTRRLVAAGLKAVPTGVAHGTVTAVAEGVPYEITTFRADVETDGRRAVVRFTEDMAEDAARRDFTMNALYADADGRVVDPLGGLADLRAGRVRFIGRAKDRIREDYLRILRFFRFTAWYGRDGIDADGLAACAELADGVDRLARERVGAEMKTLLAAPDPAPAVAAMSAAGVLARVLPGAETAGLAPLVHVETATGAAPDWRRRLLAMSGPLGAAFGELLRLSKAELRALEAVAAALAEALPPAQAAQRHGAEAARSAALLAAAAAGRLPQSAVEAEIARGSAARFPLTARDLIAAGFAPGPELGAALAAAEAHWRASDFKLDKAELIAESAKKRQQC